MSRTAWVILSLLVLGAGGSTWYFIHKSDDKPVALDAGRPFMGVISRSVTATGSIEPVDTVAVGTQESGTISKVYVDFNTTVRKGELIAELDKSLLNASVEQYEASLNQAKSQLVYEKANFDRQQLLYNVGAIAKADYETAEYSYQSADAGVGTLTAELKAARQNLAYASIYSPIDGTVMSRNISVGQTVAASFNTPTLFIIAKDLTKMQVQAAVDEADIGNVRDSQRVTFTVDAFPNDVFVGTVQDVRLEPTVASNVVTYTTIINAPNQDRKLKPGMTANISIYTKVDSNAMLIPAKALKFTPDQVIAKTYKVFPDSTARGLGGATKLDTVSASGNNRKGHTDKGKKASVWKIEGDSLIQQVIRIGLNDDNNVEVLEGLAGDEDVVVGVRNPGSPAPAKAGAPSSPFLPRRNSTPPKKPAS